MALGHRRNQEGAEGAAQVTPAEPRDLVNGSVPARTERFRTRRSFAENAGRADCFNRWVQRKGPVPQPRAGQWTDETKG